MSKNLTRKGLALGTAAALAVAGLSAAPAFAADPVKISSKFGSSYSVPLYSGFTFNLSGTDLASAIDNDSLAFAITAPTGTSVYWETDNDDATITGDGTAQVVSGNLLDAGDPTTLYIDLSNPAAAADVKVVAFIDDENIGTLDATEAQYSRTVKFVKPTLSVALDTPFIGDAALTGTVSLGSVNVDQASQGLADNASVEWLADLTVTENGVLDADADVAGTDAVVEWNATDKVFDFSVDVTVGAADKFIVQGYTKFFDTSLNPDAAAWEKSGTAVKVTVAADKIDTVDTPTIASGANSIDNGDGTGLVRASEKSVTVTAQAWEDNQVTKAPAGQPVRVDVTADVQDADSKFTVGGKTFDDDGDTATYFTTTNANGQVVITLTGVFADLDNVDISFDVQDVANVTYSITFESTDEDAVVATSVNNDGVLTVKNDASYSITYAAVDQFGQALSGKYRLAISSTGNGQDDFTANLTGGKATVSFTDASTADDDYTVSADLKVYDADTKTWGDAGLAAVEVDVQSLKTLLTAAAVDGLSAVDGLGLESEKFVNADLRLNAADPGFTNANGDQITGTIVDADGYAVSGAKVTVSANGLQFADESEDIYATDSITVYADDAGEFTVDVWSHTAGKIAITVASGSAKETVNYTWDSPTAVDLEDNKFTLLSTRSSVAAGSVLVLTAKLTDKWGNAVAPATAAEVIFSVDGAGYLSNETVKLTSKGTARATLITGLGDAGLVTVTASLNEDNNDAAENVDDVSVSALVGVSATVSAGSKKANVVVKNASGLTVKVVSGTKSTTKVSTSDSYKLSLSKLTSGSKTVKVYVEGILVASKKVTVK